VPQLAGLRIWSTHHDATVMPAPILMGMMKRVMACLVAAAVVVLPVRPAHASVTGPVRYDASSEYNLAPLKQAQVSCPDDTVVYGTGGQINDGDGDVVMLAIVPAQDLSSVTVLAAALPGHVGPWSVTAYAVCFSPDGLSPKRVMQPGLTSTATASCKDGRVVHGTGYELRQPPGQLFLYGLVPDPNLTEVTVRARGQWEPYTVVAYAVCAYPISYQRCEGTNFSGGPSPNVAVTVCPPVRGTGQVFGVGGLVSLATDVYIDALVPGPNLDAAIVRAARLPAQTAQLTGGDDDYVVTAFGSEIGSWY
jgi:hypothetical protein